MASKSNIKTSNKKEKRLESIKKAHSKKNTFTTTMEDYLEVISELVELKGYASPTDISNYMNVRPPSVTKMLRRLDADGYLKYTKYQGLKLTAKGTSIANDIRQKHSDLLDFFEIIGVDSSAANKDVEGIEHHMNPKTMKQLRKFTTFLKSNPNLLLSFDRANL
ncbi:Transcriptional regulator MntR protein [Marine Group I thaumarchaeote SCGC AAA799-E16]|uniref:Transcriptional regulator MntR protein n=5 Tax=Marine Group I TaxID=905826 RepID=A0A087S3H0_9ARCH|nr:Transcriptional regulator MntR protein [Marine Group I thaumarchaeote SCGC AAA799-N04]KER06125.1 Transcriptional regulator MntR protein [Marine Group I thaumarchaeote SCGC AAA799-E16]KFM15861.1 Transcriptional regulator MntR protein [Marine Group I thaumarchaeote SCGC AAA799-D11]KFM17426.1 Transcriptional regulator MntR protein [Marine Group I thaumarchaeote SCGC RSA3]KFM20274.1 Transcriptional regulator MntR protein [Marine Group I thaumarchaeote SCGC AAA799-P11]